MSGEPPETVLLERRANCEYAKAALESALTVGMNEDMMVAIEKWSS